MASVVLLNGFQDGAFARVAMRFYIVGTATPSDYTFPAGVGTTLYIVLVLVTLALCTVTLWKGFRGIRGVILSLVFLGGYGTRVMLGFSPTVYVSGVRTCLFVFLTTIVISGFMILEALLRAERRKSSDAGGESRFIPHCASEQQ